MPSTFRAVGVVVLLAAIAEAGPLISRTYITYKFRGEATINTDGKDMRSIAVYAYEFTEDGGIAPHDSWTPAMLDQLMDDPRGREIYIVIVNHIQTLPGQPSRVHNGDLLHAILSDPARRADHIQQLVQIADGAHGIALDYERMRGKTRPYYTTFIQELRQALPVGKKIMLVMPPKTDNQIGDGGRAIDWRAVEPYVDYMQVMAYYYSWATSPHGPIVTMDQLRRLALYAMNDPAQSIPRSKLGILLSFYGWDWPMPVGTRGLLVDYNSAMAIAQSHGVTPSRHPTELTLHFFYPGDDGVQHEIWIDDFESQRARVELLQSLDVPNIDFWHLNTGDRRLWDWIVANVEPLGGTPGPTPTPPPTGSGSDLATDFDGNGSSDLAFFRPSDGRWRIDTSHDGTADSTLLFGQNGDVAVPGDYDGDGRADVARYRPSTGNWAVDTDRNGTVNLTMTFGASGDVPVPGDYDGNGTTDFAVWRPADGRWLADTNRDGVANLSIVFGRNGDVPVPGDYDGNGRTDLAVWRRAYGRWYVSANQTGGTTSSATFGVSSDLPIAADYDGNGRTDFAVWRPSEGRWLADTNGDGAANLSVVYGRNGDVPAPGDYDGNGTDDFSVYRAATGVWWFDTNRNGGTDFSRTIGTTGDRPLREGGAVLDAMGLTP